MAELLYLLAWPENYEHYEICEPVTEITEEILELADSMFATMDHYKGIGLAAPQVSHNIRMIIMRSPSFPGGVTMLNPEIMKTSPGKVDSKEGCLSFPGKTVTVRRYKWVTIVYTNLSGQTVRRKLYDLDAFCVQHEIDHLFGISIL